MKRLVVVGAGPIGLHAALQATMDGFDVTVLERGGVADAIRRWKHVRLFTPFSMNSTAVGRRVVAETESLPGPDEILSGEEYIGRYLIPLAGAQSLAGRIHTSTELLAASRQACGKSKAIGNPQRSDFPFRLLIRRADRSEAIIECDVLLDCSGFITQHRSIGNGGVPCPGERDCLSESNYEIADRSGAVMSAPHAVVIGSGYSAATSVCILHESCEQISWITRGNRASPIVPVANDSLPERDRLTRQANRLALSADSSVRWIPSAQIESIEQNGAQYSLRLSFPDGHQETLNCQRIIANPGYRPDTRPFEELQIHRCYATEGPIRLAAHLLGEAAEDCVSQTPPGPELLRNPEPNFFVLGAASYGRDSRFLLQHGLEQVEQLFHSALCPSEAVT